VALPTFINVFVFRMDAMSWLSPLHNCLVVLWSVIGVIASTDDGVMLGNDGGAFSQHSEFSPCEFVEKVSEGVVVFVLLLHVLDGELQLALHLPHEHVVDEHVIVLLIKLILDTHQLELTLHFLRLVQQTQ
jgi:hypothetical protein